MTATKFHIARIRGKNLKARLERIRRDNYYRGNGYLNITSSGPEKFWNQFDL